MSHHHDHHNPLGHGPLALLVLLLLVLFQVFARGLRRDD